jgi:hypothetical protein
MNQAELISKLAKGLVYIADALPHIELRTILYPTEKMKTAVATLYAHILQFMQRAAKWYSESKIRHAVGSIFKPYALSFQDILDEISTVSREVDMLALSASMAEQRGMHLEQRNMHMDQRCTHKLLVDVSTALQGKQSKHDLEYPGADLLSNAKANTGRDPRHEQESLRHSILANPHIHLRSVSPHPRNKPQSLPSNARSTKKKNPRCQLSTHPDKPVQLLTTTAILGCCTFLLSSSCPWGFRDSPPG